MEKRIVILTIAALILFFGGTAVEAQWTEVDIVPNDESLHPYNNYTDQWWVYTQPGADSMQVFLARVDVENYWDRVYIYDQNNTYYTYYTGGNHLNFWSVSVPGETIKVRFYSDYSITDWGVEIDKYRWLEIVDGDGDSIEDRYDLCPGFPDAPAAAYDLDGDGIPNDCDKPASGNALDFDGDNDHVVIPDSTSFDCGAGPFTLEFWFHKKSETTARRNSLLTWTDSFRDEFSIYVDTDSRVKIKIEIAAEDTITIDSGLMVTPDAWRHFALVRDGAGNIATYLDGMPGGTGLSTASLDSIDAGSDIILGSLDGGNATLLGQMDEVRFWRSARSQAQIRDYMCRKIDQPTVESDANLIAYYRFDQTGVDVLTDYRGDNHARLVDMNPVSDWVASGAPIGDWSVLSYPAGLSLAYNGGGSYSDFLAASITGAPSGAHIYRVNEAPNDTTIAAGSLLKNHYFGTYFIGGINPTYTVSIDYTNHAGIDQAEEELYDLATRTNNAAGTWTELDADLDTIGDLLAKTDQGRAEFIIVKENDADFDDVSNDRDLCPGFPDSDDADNDDIPDDCDLSASGKALSFDGVNDYVSIKMDFPQTDYTYEFWFKTSVTPAYISSVRDNPLGSSYDREIYLDGSGRIFHRLWNNEVINSSGVNYADGQWHHLAIVVNAASGQFMYVDGVQVAAGVKTFSDFNWDTHLTLGYSNGGYFPGQLDEVRIWTEPRFLSDIRITMCRKLTQSEVRSSTTLLAYYRFDQPNSLFSTTLTDYKATFNGVLTNINYTQAWVTSGAPLGDASANQYPPADFSLAGNAAGINFSLSNFSNNSGGIHIYRVDDEANTLTVPAGYDSLINSYDYFGVFRANNPGLTFTITDYFPNHADESLYGLVTRDNNADLSWQHLGAALHEVLNNLDKDQVGYGEFLIGYIQDKDGDNMADYYDLCQENPASGDTDSDGIANGCDPPGSGYALTFDGADDYVNCGAGIDLANKSFTIEFWAKRDGINSNDFVIGLGTYQNTNQFLHIGFRNTNQFTFAFYGNDANTAPYLDTGWHHWACVYDASAAPGFIDRKIYRDGVLILDNEAAANFQGSGNCTIGTTYMSSHYCFDGSIDEVRIWEVVRTDAQIRTTMCQKFDQTALPANLVAYYRLDQPANPFAAIVADFKGQNIGRIVNMDQNNSWVRSGAFLGDDSANDYDPIGGYILSGTSTFGDALTVSSLSGTYQGLQAYVTYGPPHSLTFSGGELIANPGDPYYGVYPIGSDCVYAITYDFTNHPNAPAVNDSVDLARRNDNSDNNWVDLNTVLNPGDRLTTTVSGAGEFILAGEIDTDGDTISDERDWCQENPASGDTDLDDIPNSCDPPGSGYALDFDGVDDYVNCGSNINLANQSFTVEFWVKRNSSGTNDYVLAQGNSPALNNYLHLGFLNNSRFRFGFLANDLDTPGAYPETDWHHWACIYDAATSDRCIIRDGIEVASGTSAPYQGTGNLTLGNALFWVAGNPFHGQIDEVKVWNVARTVDEIRADMCHKYDQGFALPAGLIAYYRLDQPANPYAIMAADFAGENPGRLTNMDQNTDWVVSAAPIGDISAYDYTSSLFVNMAHPDGDDLTAVYANAPNSGLHLYRVDEEPNSLTVSADFVALFEQHYFGAFKIGGGSYDVVYNYFLHAQIGSNPETLLGFANRDDNADLTWANTWSEADSVANTFTRLNQTGGEYILGLESDTDGDDMADSRDVCKDPDNTDDDGDGIPNSCDRPGSGQALVFDGDDDYIELATPLPIGTTSHTIELWVKVPQPGTDNLAASERVGVILGNYNEAPNANWEIDANGQVRIYWNAAQIDASGSLDLRDGQWHHLAYVRDKIFNQYRVYVDGVVDLIALSAGADITFTTNHLFGADRRLGNSPNFHGQMDEIRIWNTARSENEIRTFMCQKLDQTALPGNLTAYFRADQPAQSIAVSLADFSGTNFGRMVNMDPTSDWLISGAPIGDTSAFDYSVNPTISLITPGHLDILAQITNGTIPGLHVYLVDETPSDTTLAGGSLLKDHYVGAFAAQAFAGYDYAVDLDYSNYPTPPPDSLLDLAQRESNADPNWEQLLADLDVVNDVLSKPYRTNAEFALMRAADSDTDFVSDNRDRCPGYKDYLDDDHDGIPNDCDMVAAGNALYFDGLNDYVRVPHRAEIQPGTALTVEVWVNLTDSSRNQKIVGKSPIGQGFVLGVNSGGLYPEIWDTWGTKYSFVAGAIPSTTWAHLAITWQSGGQMIGYVNGIQVASIAASGLPIGWTANDLIIGLAPWDWHSWRTQGVIDELKIWNVARGAIDIRDDMCRKYHQASLPANLIMYYRFDQPGSTILTDARDINHGYLTNGPTWQTSGAPIGDLSGHDYAGGTAPDFTVTMANGIADRLTFTGQSGAFSGLQAYLVNDAPNSTLFANGALIASAADPYYGVFPIGTNAACQVLYEYANHPHLPGQESRLDLASRADNTQTEWQDTDSQLDVTGQTLLLLNSTRNEFILSQEIDTDGEGVSDDRDRCPGFNDFADSDGDKLPNDCDLVASGNTLAFDGGNYVAVPDHPALDLSDRFTIEAWFYPASLSSANDYQAILGKGRSPNGTGYCLLLNPDQSITLGLNFAGINTGATTPVGSIAPGQWCHVAGTYDGSTVFLYLNGVQQATLDDPTINLANSTEPLYIGRELTQLPRYFKGFIDEVRIWDTPRSLNDIRQTMCRRLTQAEVNSAANLMAYYRFDQPNDVNATALVDSKQDLHGQLGNFDPTTDWVVSGAPLGDQSQFDYTGTNPGDFYVMFANGITDLLQINGYTGTWSGIQVYLVDSPPNSTAFADGTLIANADNFYYGVFPVGSEPIYSYVYYYANIPNRPANENVLDLAHRGNNAVGTWTATNASLATGSDLLIKYFMGPNEVIPAIEADSDGDNVRDNRDICPGFDDYGPDTDGDRIPDTCDWNASGNTLDFDGNDDYLVIPEDPWLTMIDFTVSFWVKSPSGSYASLIERGIGAASGADWYFVKSNSGNGVTFGMQHAGTTNEITYDWTHPGWHHVAGTYDGTTMQLYVDGILRGTTTSGKTYDVYPIYIGRNSYGVGSSLAGQLDEVRIWRDVRTETEIRDWMCRQLDLNDPANYHLVAYYRFDQANSSSVIDLTKNGYTAHLVNMSPASDWQTSGAAIGDISAYDYNNLNPVSVTLLSSDGDDLTVSSASDGAAAGWYGLQVYRVDTVPNATGGLPDWPTAPYHYYGVFPCDLSTFDAAWLYTGHAGIDDENNVRLARRDDNTDGTWEDTNARLFTPVDSLVKAGLSRAELILTERVNHAPVVGGSSGMTAILEDTSPAANAGTRVQSIINNLTTFNEIDGDQKGIAVVRVDETNGVWQYSLNDGVGWLPLGSAAETSARLFSGDTNNKIRFLPNPDHAGVDSMMVRGWDLTNMVNNQVVDITAIGTGDPTAFSQDTAPVYIVVTNANDGPMVNTIPNQSKNEGTPFDSIDLDDFVSDPDNEDATLVWSSSGEVNLAVTINSSTHVATITPDDINWNGTEEIIFTVRDPGALTDADTVRFEVIAVDDPPVVNNPIPDIVENEDPPVPRVINLGTTFTDVDNDDDNIIETVIGQTNPGLITTMIDPAAHLLTLNFTPNSFGTDSIRVQAVSGGQSVIDTFRVTVNPINDPPEVVSESFKVFTEGDPAKLVSPSITLTDIDNTSLSTVRVFIENGYIAAEDTLTVTDSPLITTSFNDALGELSFTPNQPVAEYKSILQTVKYRNTNLNDPDESIRVIKLAVSDGALADTSQTLMVVFGVNDAPTLAVADTLHYTEGDPASVIAHNIQLQDVDNDSLVSIYAAISSGISPAEDSLWIDGWPASRPPTFPAAYTLDYNRTTGLLTLAAEAGLADYLAILQNITYVNTNSNNPSTIPRVISYGVDDGTLSATANALVFVNGVNDDPEITVGNTMIFTEGNNAQDINNFLSVTDPDNFISDAVIEFSMGFIPGEDTLLINSPLPPGILKAYDPAMGELTLFGAAPASAYEAALRHVAYDNLNEDNPTPGDRSLSFTITDLVDAIDTDGAVIRVVAVNDAPEITTRPSFSYTENDAAVIIDPNLTLTDPDGPDMTGATVTISSGFHPAEDVLTAAPWPGIAVSFDGVSGILRLTSATHNPVADYEAMLRTVNYENTNNANPSTNQRVITFSVSDGAATDQSVTTIELSDEPDPPVLIVRGEASYVEDQPGVVLDSNLTFNDVDTPEFTEVSARINSGLDLSEDMLAATTTPTIQAQYNLGTLTLSAIGPSALVGDFQAVLRTVTYTNLDSGNPTLAPRQIIFTAEDDFNNEVQDTVVVVVVPVNDAPVVTTRAEFNFNEDSPPAPIDNNLSLQDVDNTMMNGARIIISSGYNAQEDILAARDTLNIISAYANGVLTVSGSASVGHYRQVLQTVTYWNTNITNPDNSNREIQFIVSDGALADTSITTVHIIRANDAPVLVTAIGDTTASEDGPFTRLISRTAFADADDGDSLTFSATKANGDPLPDWLTFDDTIPQLSGVPGNANVGERQIKIMVTDRSGETAADIFVLSVLNTNDAPTVANALPDKVTAEDASFIFTIPNNTFQDVDAGDELTYSMALVDSSAANFPLWFSFNAGSRTLIGTPTNDDVGLLDIIIKVVDDSSMAVRDTFNLAVTNVNDKPTIANPIADRVAFEDLPFDYTLPPGTFQDVDAGDALTFSATLADGSPLSATWVTFTEGTLNFAGIPGNSHVTHDYTTPLSIRVRATDLSNAWVSDVFEIDVYNTNDAPAVQDTIPNQQATEDGAFSYTVLATTFTDEDTLYGDVLTYSATEADGTPLPGWLSFAPGPRIFSGTPANEDRGTHSIKVTATDQSGVDESDIFDIVVDNVDDPPQVINPINDVAVDEDADDVFIDLSGVFIDPDNSVSDVIKTLEANSNPALVAATVLNNTTLKLAFAENAFGNGELIIRAASSGQSIADTLLVTVAPVNDPPMAIDLIENQSATEDAAFSYQFPGAIFSDVDTGDVLSYEAAYSINNVPVSTPWLSLDSPTRTFSGTPGNDDVTLSDPQRLKVTVTAHDQDLASASTSFFIWIYNTNDPPYGVAPIPDQVVEEGLAFNYQILPGSFHDDDLSYGDRLTFDASLADGQPLNTTWLTFFNNSQTFSGTPTNADVGSLSIIVEVSDVAGEAVSDTFSVTVTNLNNPPVVQNPIADRVAFEDLPFDYPLPENTFVDPDAGDVITYRARLTDGTELDQTWLAFDTGSRTFSGTPLNADVTNNIPGVQPFEIIVYAVDAADDSTWDVFQVDVINTNDAPVTTAEIPDQTAFEEQPFEFQFADTVFSDVDFGDTLDYSAVQLGLPILPGWLAFDNGTRTFSGVPQNEDRGLVTIVVTAADLAGAEVSVPFDIHVTNEDDPPEVAVPIPDMAVSEDAEDEFIDLGPVFMDPDNEETAITKSVVANTNPALVTVSFPGPNTLKLSFTPNGYGWAEIVVQALSFELTVTDTFRVTVTPVNDSPILMYYLPTLYPFEDEPFVYTFGDSIFQDMDPDDVLSFTVAYEFNNQPVADSWLSFAAGSRTFEGVPENEMVGIWTVYLTATDVALDFAETSFEIWVLNTNDAPYRNSPIPDAVVMEGVQYNYQIPPHAFIDEDPGDFLTYDASLSDGSPLADTWLAFFPSTQVFNGTPQNDDVGSMQIVVRVQDLQGEAVSDTFSITVTNQNNPPVVSNPIADRVIFEDLPFDYPLPANTFTDVDAADAVLTYTAALTDGTSLSETWLSFDAVNVIFSGVPGNDDVTNGISDPMEIRVTATDCAQVQTSDVFSIDVVNINDAPYLNSNIPNQTAIEEESFLFTFADNVFKDVDLGDILTFRATQAAQPILPGWLDFDGNSRTFAGVPENDDSGEVTIEVKATDIAGAFASTLFIINVTNQDDPPGIAHPIPDMIAYEDAPDTLVDLSNVFTDQDNEDFAIVKYVDSNSDPDLVTAEIINNNNINLSFTPNGFGQAIIGIRGESFDKSVVDTFVVTVHPVNDPPTAAGTLSSQIAPEDNFFLYGIADDFFTDVDPGDTLHYQARLLDGSSLSATWLSFEANNRVFSGTPLNDDVGQLNIRITATDLGQESVSTTLTVIVPNTNDSPVLTSLIPDQTATEDQPFNFPLPGNTFADADVMHGDILSYSATLVNGTALNSTWIIFYNNTLVFSGTPSSPDIGAWNVIVTVTDASGSSASDVFTIYVENVNNAPEVANSLAGQNTWEDLPFFYRIPAATFADDDNDPLAITYYITLADGTPTEAYWLTFDDSNVTFFGTPANDDVGEYLIHIIATDPQGASAETAFPLTILNSNDAPQQVLDVPDKLAIQDQPFQFQLNPDTFIDVDVGDQLHYEATQSDNNPLPAWLNFDPVNLVFYGTPTNDDRGIWSIRVWAIDNYNESEYADFDIHVDDVPDPPIVANPLSDVVVAEDAPVEYIDLTNVFTDPDNDDAQIVKSVLSNSNNELVTTQLPSSYTLVLGFPPNQWGEAVIVILATSFDQTVTDTFTVTVTSVNDPPVLQSAIADQAIQEDVPYEFSLPADLFNDVDVDDELTYEVTFADGAPLAGSWLSFDETLLIITGWPTNDEVTTELNPPYDLRITARDEEEASVSTDFSIRVNNVNDAPIRQWPLPDLVTEEGVQFNFLIPDTTFVDIDYGDRLRFEAMLVDSISLNSTWLTFFGASHTFSGTPQNEDVGDYDIVVTVDDLAGEAVRDTFTIRVENQNNAPMVINQIPPQFVDEDNEFDYIFPANIFIDYDAGDTLAYSAILADGSDLSNTWLNFTPHLRRFTGLPTNDDVGQVQLVVIATDMSQAADSTSFFVDVDNVNDAPHIAIALPDTLAATEDQFFQFIIPAATFADVDENDVLTISAELAGGGSLGDPFWLDFNEDSLILSGQPDNDDVAAWPITMTARDRAGDDVTALIVVDVQNVDDPPIVAQALDDLLVMEDAEEEFITLIGVFDDIDNNNNAIAHSLLSNSNETIVLVEVLNNNALNITFQPNRHGQAQIVIQAVSNNIAITDTFQIEIASINDPPQLAVQLLDREINERQTYADTLAANTFTDVDEEDNLTLTATIDGQPLDESWLNFDADTWIFTGTPQSTDVGGFLIRVTAVDDSSASVFDEFAITVLNVNDAPEVAAGISNQTALENGPFTLSIPANAFSDPDADDELTYTATLADGSPLSNTWLDFDGAAFSGIPMNNDVGLLVIKVTASDIAGASNFFVFELRVENTNDPPELVNPIPAQVTEQWLPGQSVFTYTVPVTTFNDSDLVYGDALNYSASLPNSNPLPEWLTFDRETRTFTGQPANLDVGVYEIIIRVSDSEEETATDNFNLTVNNVNEPPFFTADLADTIAVKDREFVMSIPRALFDDADLMHDDSLRVQAALEDGTPLSSTWLPSFNPTTLTLRGTPSTLDSLRIRLTVSDRADASVNQVFSVNVIDIVPHIREVIQSVAGVVNAMPVEGESFNLTAKIECVTPPTVTLYYGLGWQVDPADSFTVVFADENDRLYEYSHDIPAGMVTYDGFWYRYKVSGIYEDYTSIEYYPSAENRADVTIQISDFAAILARGLFPEGLPNNSWYTVSLPFDGASVSLESMFGQPQQRNSKDEPTNWVGGIWDNNFNEYIEIDRVLSRESYLIKHALGGDYFLTPADGLATTSGLNVFSETVLSSGHNFFAWPYPYSADIEPNRNLISIIYAHLDGGWVEVDQVHPYGGYYVNRAGGEIMLGDALNQFDPINPFESTALTLDATSDAAAKDLSWSMRFEIATPSKHDRFNVIGAAPGANDLLDYWDSSEPPGLGDYIALYFTHTDEWGEGKKLAHDIRSESGEGHTWEMVIENYSENTALPLLWHTENLLPDYRVCIIDISANHIPEDAGNSYSVVMNSNRHTFKVLVGTPDYVAARREEITRLLPQEFVLRQNFPNPFNPATTVEFALPQANPVKLRVYNVGGQLVRTLVDDYLETGFYSYRWDSRNDHGQKVASGVYFYRLEAGPYGQTRRMLLLK